jgi:exonuclease III
MEQGSRYKRSPGFSIGPTYGPSEMTLRTLTWNVEGLKAVTNLILDDLLQTYDAVIFTDTFLATEWSISNFYAVHTFAKNGEKGRPKGGITCLMKPKLSPFSILYRTDNIMAIKIKLCTLIAAYFQPDFGEDKVIAEIMDTLSTIPSRKSVLMAGDFNCRIDTKNHKSNVVIEVIE